MDFLIYVGAIGALSLIDIGIPAFIAARRLGHPHPALALIPFGDVYTLASVAGRRGWSRIWPGLLIWGPPLVLGVASITLYLSISPEERATSSAGGLPLVGAGLVPFVVIRGLWREVCWQTEQRGRWVWVAGLPFLGALRSWPIAFRVPRGLRGGSPARRLLLAPTPAAAESEQPERVAELEPAKQGGGPWHQLPPVWLLSNVVLLVLVGGFLVADKTALHWYSAPSSDLGTATLPTAAPTSEPDVVVGVLRVCDGDGESVDRYIATQGCAAAKQKYLFREGAIFNDRLEVTVRSSAGGSYVVYLQPYEDVQVGDIWP